MKMNRIRKMHVAHTPYTRSGSSTKHSKRYMNRWQQFKMVLPAVYTKKKTPYVETYKYTDSPNTQIH